MEDSLKLIHLCFQECFEASYRTRLTGGHSEPFYLAPKEHQFGELQYRENFSSSALHEIAHWCLAGNSRLQKNDFGFWYAPAGRSQEEQMSFYAVEVKPQALEWAFSLVSGVRFQLSADNIDGPLADIAQFQDKVGIQFRSWLASGFPERAHQFMDQMWKYQDSSHHSHWLSELEERASQTWPTIAKSLGFYPRQSLGSLNI